MDRSRVPESWIDCKVWLIPLGRQGESLPELRGWFRGIEDGGIWFAKAFYSDSLHREMPEQAKLYPWEMVGHLEPRHE